jgi:integrase/recombinase XerD
MTELRRRMLEELRLRNYSPHTQRAYIRCLANFAKHFGTAPDRLGPEHIRDYQLFLVQQKKLSWSPFNQTVCALRFFYHHVLHRKWIIEHIPYPRHEQKLPVVLSPAEVAALFQNTPNLKHRAILMTLYAAGLRVSEVINLRVTDIDRQRQLIFIRQGKGHKDRQLMLSPKLLEILQLYWKRYRPMTWLFPGAMPGAPDHANHGLAHLPAGARRGPVGQTGIAPHLAALLRHSSAGSGDRSAPHPDSDGAS